MKLLLIGKGYFIYLFIYFIIFLQSCKKFYQQPVQYAFILFIYLFIFMFVVSVVKQ